MGRPRIAYPRISAAVARMRLSTRASEIVVCIAMGDTTQQVAERLGIEVAMVRKGLQEIFRKTGINSPVELVSVVLANVIADVDPDGPLGRGTLAVESKAAVDAEPHVVHSR